MPSFLVFLFLTRMIEDSSGRVVCFLEWFVNVIEVKKWGDKYEE